MDIPKVVVFLGEDPNKIQGDWINLQPNVAGIEIVAYVVPMENIAPMSKRNFNGVPIYAWEDPGENQRRARQYLDLFRKTDTDYVIPLGWPREILYGQGDLAYMIAISPLLFQVSTGQLLSRIIHRRIYGDFKRDVDGKLL